MDLAPNGLPDTPGVPGKRTRIQATRIESFAIMKALEAHTRETPDLARRTYAEGWDDKKIAEAVAPRLTAEHVSYCRKQLYPNWHVPKKRTIEERLATLEEQVAYILTARVTPTPLPAPEEWKRP